MKKKPCRICRRWFTPELHAGSRQVVCSMLECQAERRRRNAAAWRLANADEIAADRLRARLRARPEPAGEQVERDPISRLSAPAVRIAVGLKLQVVVEEYARVVLLAPRMGVPSGFRDERVVSPEVRAAAGKGPTASARAPP